jgi:hypothetical protein
MKTSTKPLGRRVAFRLSTSETRNLSLHHDLRTVHISDFSCLSISARPIVGTKESSIHREWGFFFWPGSGRVCPMFEKIDAAVSVRRNGRQQA